jgi:hypothetical protein
VQEFFDVGVRLRAGVLEFFSLAFGQGEVLPFF